MARTDPRIMAVLGPTNTGKTHLAIERLAAHASGMIGLPLRLLAREVYDRVVAIKGAGHVALITGEERIVPAGARWFACTTEAMPVARDVALVAIDEAQLGAHPERGHVFTDRILNARGREETLILGSDTLRPVLRRLLPEAEIVARPRFSTLRYSGAKKLSRLPPRSAIVAFTVEDVYAIAEQLRRLRGGAAVVMGALSPRTRNAQVAMFQSGEVDYLVATDAIGMGLNLDVDHVAFAGLGKFDGHRSRRLSVAEMAQIAGRAGRHQRDGTFGEMIQPGARTAMTPEEIERIEAHRFEPVEQLCWRNADLDRSNLPALIASLERRPNAPALRPAPEAEDLAVLRRLATDPAVAADSADAVDRLWSLCGVPDFRDLGIEPHARFLAGLWQHLGTGSGLIPDERIAAEIARLDRIEGDIATLSARLAGIRSWAYIAQRADWLADPEHWSGRARAVEERLSDTLHERLRQAFVDRRARALHRMRGDGHGGNAVAIDEDRVTIAGEAIGVIDGFRFVVDAAARGVDRRRLLAAGEARITAELATRVAALRASSDQAFAIIDEAGVVPAIGWNGIRVASLLPGKGLLRPVVKLVPELRALDQAPEHPVRGRIEAWLCSHIADRLGALVAAQDMLRDAATPAPLRAVLAPLLDHGGALPRRDLARALDPLSPPERIQLRRCGVTVGTVDVFFGTVIKPAPLRLLAVLDAVRQQGPMPPLPPANAVLIDHRYPGFRWLGSRGVRVDLAERILRAQHGLRQGRQRFAPDPALATSLGLSSAEFARLLAQAGFNTGADGKTRWHRPRPAARPAATPPPGHPFAALAVLVRADD